MLKTPAPKGAEFLNLGHLNFEIVLEFRVLNLEFILKAMSNFYCR
jgi:hypothetical protein